MIELATSIVVAKLKLAIALLLKLFLIQGSYCGCAYSDGEGWDYFSGYIHTEEQCLDGDGWKKSRTLHCTLRGCETSDGNHAGAAFYDCQEDRDGRGE